MLVTLDVSRRERSIVVARGHPSNQCPVDTGLMAWPCAMATDVTDARRASQGTLYDDVHVYVSVSNPAYTVPL